jgi:hypothetical protein
VKSLPFPRAKNGALPSRTRPRPGEGPNGGGGGATAPSYLHNKLHLLELPYSLLTSQSIAAGGGQHFGNARLPIK